MAKCSVTFEYSIGDKVYIIELKRPGRVKSLSRDCQGIEYYVRYFYDGTARSVYFYKDELRKEK